MYIDTGIRICVHFYIISLKGAKKIMKHVKEKGYSTTDIDLREMGCKSLLKQYTWCKFDHSDSEYKVYPCRSSGLVYQRLDAVDDFPHCVHG